MLTSWSPPGHMKESGQTAGGAPGTYIKYTEGEGFDYDSLAQWWVESIREFRNIGIPCRYVSLQNEPTFSTAEHDCCVFDEEENVDERIPGYNQLVIAAHEKINCEVDDPPGLIGPEHVKIDGYLPTGDLLDKFEVR